MHTKLNTALRLMAPRQEFLQVLQQVSKKSIITNSFNYFQPNACNLGKKQLLSRLLIESVSKYTYVISKLESCWV